MLIFKGNLLEVPAWSLTKCSIQRGFKSKEQDLSNFNLFVPSAFIDFSGWDQKGTLGRKDLTVIRKGLTVIRKGLTVIRKDLTVIRKGLTVIRKDLTVIRENSEKSYENLQKDDAILPWSFIFCKTLMLLHENSLKISCSKYLNQNSLLSQLWKLWPCNVNLHTWLSGKVLENECS